MWQTIQLLLGPEEHAGFIREAVQQWDIRDPDTGDLYPKILPRRCFPEAPDKHMVAWYEGVSERLRREADEEERQKRIEATQDDAPRPRRSQGSQRKSRADDDDDDGSVDSRAPTIAYFRNPLYRHVDGRPSIVRRSSRKPGPSPRPSMMMKGKEAASTFGQIAKHIGSPHLWDGGRSRSGSETRERRRRSNAELSASSRGHHASGNENRADPASYDSRLSSPAQGGRRRASQPTDRLGPGNGRGGGGESDGDNRRHSAYAASSGLRPNSRHDSADASLRSRSQEQTPVKKEFDDDVKSPEEDYFTGFDDPARNPAASNSGGNPSSTNDEGSGNVPPGVAAAAAAVTAGAAGAGLASASVASPNDEGISPGHESRPPAVGPSFEPSTSPLFASQIARQPQPFPPPGFHRQQPSTSQPNSPPNANAGQGSQMPFRGSNHRPREDETYDRRYPRDDPRSHTQDARPGSGRRDRYDDRPSSAGPSGSGPYRSPPSHEHHKHHSRHHGSRDYDQEGGQHGRRSSNRLSVADREGQRPSSARPSDSHARRRHHDPYLDDRRRSGDYDRRGPRRDGYRDDDRRDDSDDEDYDRRSSNRSPLPPPPQKQTRFADDPAAETGVGGRRYPEFDDRGRDYDDVREQAEKLYDTEDEEDSQRYPPARSSSQRKRRKSRSRSRRDEEDR